MENLFNRETRRRLARRKYDNLSVTSVIRDFTSNTSIHGIKYLVHDTRNSGRVAQLFWMCIVIVALVGSGLMIKLFWNRYQAHPIVSAIDSFYAPSFLTSFPGLTVCPISDPDSKIRLRLLQRLRLPDGISKERASVLFEDAFDMAHPRAGMDEDRQEMNEILKLNDYHIAEFLVALRSPCESIVESCWWDYKRISCPNFFRLSYTFGGLCCSFNYLLEDHVSAIRTAKNITPIRPVNFGVNSGLTLIFKGNQFISNDDNGTIERLTSNTIGLLVFIHHSMVYPDSSSLILQAGREMQIRVSPRENSKVPGVGGENKYPCSPEEVRIKYFAEYWKENCHNSCRIRASLALCQCVPWLFAPFVEQRLICGFSQMKCLRVNYQQIWSVMYVNDPIVQCFCPTRCKIQNYQVTHSQIPIAAKIFSPSLVYRNLSTGNAVLKMYIGEQVYEKAVNLIIADEIYLLSSIGGIFSLFLGCSILSLCEIIYFVYILIKSWIRKKIQHQKDKRWR